MDRRRSLTNFNLSLGLSMSSNTIPSQPTPTAIINNIHEAAERGDLLALNILLQKTPVSQKEDSWLERTALHAAASRKGNIDAVKLLVNKGADINATDKTLWAPLHYACFCCDLQSVEFLLKNGAQVTLECDDGSLPLHKFVKNKSEPLETYLTVLEQLAPQTAINHPTRRGETPLHAICLSLHSHDQTLRYLLNRGAKINLPDKKGYVPLHYAILTGRKELVKTLLEFGADTTIPSQQGSCRDLAVNYYHQEIASLFSHIYEFLNN